MKQKPYALQKQRASRRVKRLLDCDNRFDEEKFSPESKLARALTRAHKLETKIHNDALRALAHAELHPSLRDKCVPSAPLECPEIRNVRVKDLPRAAAPQPHQFNVNLYRDMFATLTQQLGLSAEVAWKTIEKMGF